MIPKNGRQAGMEAVIELATIASQSLALQSRASKLEQLSGTRLPSADVLTRCAKAARVLRDQFAEKPLSSANPPRGFSRRLEVGGKGETWQSWQKFFESDPNRWRQTLLLADCLKRKK